VNHLGQIFGVEIELLEKRGDEFVGIELVELFPIKFAAIHHAAAAQME
jgi:hypothetical protein